MRIHQANRKWGRPTVGNSDSDRHSITGEFGQAIGRQATRFIGVDTGANSISWNVFADGTMVTRDFEGPSGTSDSYSMVPAAWVAIHKTHSNYASNNSLNASRNGDNNGRFGKNGAGESATIDGVPYVIKGVTYDQFVKYVQGGYPAKQWNSQGFNIYIGVVEDAASFTAFPSSGYNISKRHFFYNSKTGAFTQLSTMSTADNLVLPLVAVPITPRCYVEYEGGTYSVGGVYDTGLTITSSDTPIRLKVTNPSGGAVTDIVAKVGGTTVFSAASDNNGYVDVVFGSNYSKVPNGAVSMVVTVGSGAAKSYDTTFKFTKVETGLVVTGKPVEKDERPQRCTLVYALNLGEGATAEWQVCNNANDDAPSWETYEGAGHEFANDAKQGEKWAVAWRVSVDGSAATSRSELIKQVAMAVV